MKILFLLNLLLAPLLFAQKNLPTQFVSFFGYQNVEVPTEIYLQTGQRDFTPFVLPGANATDAVKIINGTGAIVIYGKPVTDAEGKISYPRLGRIKCDPTWPKAFAIVSSIRKDEEIVFSGAAFPLSNKDFPEGSVKLANLSPALVRGRMGKKKVAFKPGDISTVRFSDQPGTLIDIILQYKANKEAPWRRMMSSRRAVPKKGRSIIFVFPRPGGTGMSSKTIPLRN